VILFPGEAEQVSHDTRCALGLLTDDRERLSDIRWNVRDLGQEVGEPDDRGKRVVEVVRDPCNQLADGRHLLRLDQLVLQAAALGLIVEQQDDSRPVGTANRHGGNGIRSLPGSKLHLSARSLLVQSPLQVGGPFRRCEGLPRPSDEARGWRIHQVSKSAVGPTYRAGPVDNAESGGDGIDHFLPGPPTIIVEVNEPGALQGYAGLRYEALK
jgi:hypothetical protein